jgi:NADH-ubiquinone oxidoreductase chain 5
MAFPFLTGFYSKDLILEVALGQYEVSGNIAYWLGTISAVFTAFYSFRLISLTFFTVPNAPKGDYLHAHEAPMIIVIPLVILSIMSIGFGYVAKDLFVGIGSDFLSAALFQHPDHISLVEAEFGLPLILKLLPAIGSLFGAALAIYLYHVVPAFTIGLTDNTIGNALYKFLNGKWLFDMAYNSYIISGGLRLGHVISKVIDRGNIPSTTIHSKYSCSCCNTYSIRGIRSANWPEVKARRTVRSLHPIKSATAGNVRITTDYEKHSNTKPS